MIHRGGGAAKSRRAFIALLGGGLAAWSPHLHAQPSAKLPMIGFLGPTSPAPGFVEAFLLRLKELGWTPGRNVVIEYRWADGQPDRIAQFAAEFARINVDVIVTGGSPVVLAIKERAGGIPIIFTSAGDPVGSGLVASLARPGGNITGLSFMTSDLAGKRLELLRQIIPDLRRLAIIANPGFPEAVLEMGEIESIAKTLGVQTFRFEVRRPDDIPSAFDAIKDSEALYVCGDPLMLGNRQRINALALNARLPTMHGLREHVEAGGLLSYGASFPSLFRRSADLVDKVLRGTSPADIPVEQPTKFDLVVNLKTAKALGLMIPETFLVRADAVLE